MLLTAVKTQETVETKVEKPTEAAVEAQQDNKQAESKQRRWPLARR